MAGITAFINFQDGSTRPRGLLNRTLSASFPLPHLKIVIAKTISPHVAFGGTFPKHFQDGCETITLGHQTLLFYGELYNELHEKSAAAFAFDAVFNNALNSLDMLNGPFVFFAWDDLVSELTIVTDRLGRFPVFYSSFADTTVVTTDLDSLLNAGIVSPDLPEESIADFLTIGFPLGEQSLFRGVKRWTGGEIVKFSRTGITRQTYWKHRSSNPHDNVESLIDALQYCVARAVHRSGRAVLTLSGGWDSRATCAIASQLSPPSPAVTYGVSGSADAEVAHLVANSLDVPHELMIPEKKFFDSFSDWAKKVISLSNGHATIDLAFQIYIYERLNERYSSVIDSAGCEFRRGVRARMAAKHAKQTDDISKFLTTMYSTGIWNDAIINTDFFHTYSSATRNKLNHWLDASPAANFEEQIDLFSTCELWAHHYAHGYPLQTNIISCQMPFSDNEFYDLFLRAVPDIRWSHRLHQAVIHRFAPQLERIPISYGSCRVPYGETILRYVPVLYHQAISTLASRKILSSLRSLDNYKPFRPYHRWYSNELAVYVSDMLSTTIAKEYLNTQGVAKLLNAQKIGTQDRSHCISILLTFVHLLEYVKGLRVPQPLRQEHSVVRSI